MTLKYEKLWCNSNIMTQIKSKYPNFASELTA